ncbi:hypothetical protein [Bacillus sp. EB01]|uniref:hypothetical protein n=1 Tax=Bacillus sp. EB01 TaxID=1347086 RepID=UPI0005C7581C|nr:hypothetical protein [Bacillus sp. EB01]
MLLYPPEHFDKNEWFILFAIGFNIAIFAGLPKRLPYASIPLIVLISISFPKLFDHTIAVAPYNFYNINDSVHFEYFDLLLYGVYPAFGYLFIYIYDFYKPRGYGLILYLLAWSLTGSALEFLLTKLGVFTYIHWNTVYSLAVYLGVLPFTLLFYLYVEKTLKTRKGSTSAKSD